MILIKVVLDFLIIHSHEYTVSRSGRSVLSSSRHKVLVLDIAEQGLGEELEKFLKVKEIKATIPLKYFANIIKIWPILPIFGLFWSY